MHILSYYHDAAIRRLKPALLEFGLEGADARLLACGIEPVTTLLVKDGKLFKDGAHIGQALDIFEHLTLPSSRDFFPAFIGFFGYEFASYLGMPCHNGDRALPDAFF